MTGLRNQVSRFIAGWSSPVARQAHNLKVISSNLVPATKYENVVPSLVRRFFAVLNIDGHS